MTGCQSLASYWREVDAKLISLTTILCDALRITFVGVWTVFANAD